VHVINRYLGASRQTLEIVKQQGSVLKVHRMKDLSSILGHLLATDWSRTIPLVEEALDNLRETDRAEHVGQLIDSLGDWVGERKPMPGLREFELKWLLGLIARLPDPSRIPGKIQHSLDNIASASDGVPLAWFAEYIAGMRKPAELWQVDLVQFVRGIEDASVSLEDRQAFDALLEHNTADDPLSQMLPEYLRRLDRNGIIVPAMIVKRLAALGEPSDSQQIIRWSMFAASYGEESDPWRTIARAACIAAKKLDRKSAGSVYWSLNQHTYSWEEVSGEFSLTWRQAVDRRRQELEQETDNDLIPYRRYRLESAESNLESQRGLHEEQTGRPF
jgi:hypothetical protein